VRVSCVCPGYTRTELQQVAEVDASRLPAASWMDPADVARSAWRGHRRGRALIVPGALNRVTTLGLRLAPRAAARRVSAAVVNRVEAVPPEQRRIR
jgi:uncharacterized protein